MVGCVPSVLVLLVLCSVVCVSIKPKSPSLACGKEKMTNKKVHTLEGDLGKTNKLTYRKDERKNYEKIGLTIWVYHALSPEFQVVALTLMKASEARLMRPGWRYASALVTSFIGSSSE